LVKKTTFQVAIGETVITDVKWMGEERPAKRRERWRYCER